jgi:hypothetical protein
MTGVQRGREAAESVGASSGAQAVDETLAWAATIRVLPQRHSHSDYIELGELSGMPSLVDVIARAQPWAVEAACRDSDAEFVMEDRPHQAPPPPATLACMRMCTCPVRSDASGGRSPLVGVALHVLAR